MRWLVLAMVGLAGVVAGGCTQTGVKPPTTVATADSADQVIEKLSHYIVRDGVRRSLVEADTAYYYEPSQTYELKNVRALMYSPDGELQSTLTAVEGTYRWQAGWMEARQNVLVETPAGKTLQTQLLRFDQTANELSTEQPFVYAGPGEHLEGNGFKADPELKNVVTQQPRGTKDSVMLLPGQ